MFQNDQLIAVQAKSIESAQAIAQLAIVNAKAITEIHYDAVKESVVAVQEKATQVLNLKDPKETLELIKAEDVQVLAAEVSAIHNKISKVLRKSNKELVEMIESVIDESQANLKNMVKEVSANTPAGSEAFVSAFNTILETTLQGFDQAYSTSKDAYASFEKSIDGAMNSLQSQATSPIKPAAKSRKAIVA